MSKNDKKRKIICRFKSQADMDDLSNRLGIKLELGVKKVDLDTKEVVYKKKVNKKKVETDDVPEWKKHWVGMPYFSNVFRKDEYAVIEFYSSMEDDKWTEVFGQTISKRCTSIWHPKLVLGDWRYYRILGGRQPKYPVYVVSKGRYEKKIWHSSQRLSASKVKHYLVVEEQEAELYRQSYENEYCTILILDKKYQEEYDVFDDSIGKGNGVGPGAARNFVWEHSMKNGFAYHHVWDDNVNGFIRIFRGRKIMAHCGEALATLEELVERYDNIAIAGFNYAKFISGQTEHPAYTLNTRIYSMLFIRNDVPYRWRGRYNEDTDLSLRVLKDGWCTLQLNAYTGDKVTTCHCKGGNTKEFYGQEGTYNKSLMLERMHPDVAKLVWKFNRYHHIVDYSGFTQKLHYREDFDPTGLPRVDEHGTYFIKITDEEKSIMGKDSAQYLEDKFEPLSDEYMNELYREGISQEEVDKEWDI